MFVGNLIAVVPPEATAAALIVVGFYMMAAVGRDLPWDSIDEGLPALLTLTIMPLTWSITNGIGAGLILYTFIKLIRGRRAELHPLLLLVTLAFVVYFLWGAA
jgi:AGZA family xanthine/uracil permease-like MFS transporter